ncbi:MAG: hypothetical protein U5O39_17230 [Gammaproteobacteria bacterium]|nr:hypothetical protein [Gammaproteobacteria bacterium]
MRDGYRQLRNRTIDVLPVPDGGFRPGQREMAVSVYRALRDGGETVIEAPTGIGKTMAALYPALRSLSSLDYDKIFFLTAKGSGRAAAREAIEDLRGEGLALTDVSLVAKEQACFNPGVPCHPEQCAYAAGYYDKLPEVLAEQAGEAARFTPEAIAALAEEKGMCPFELSLDLAGIADVVIGDYNYAFDPWVHLRRFFDDSGGRYAFLVDEAHNLVDRGRDMFSARLEKDRILSVRRRVKSSAPLLARRLRAVNDAIGAFARANRDALAPTGYCVVATFPDRLVKALRRFCEAAEEWLAAEADDAVLDCYFAASRFLKTLDLVDEDFRCLLEETERGPVLQVLAVNPAKGLRAGFQRAEAAVSFSATLSPQPYFRRVIGAKDDAAWLRVPSPFPSANLGVFATTHVSTVWRDRQHSLDELIDTIAEVVACRPGNYLVFFPSYRYLADALARMQVRYPGLDCRARGGIDGQSCP